mgnify:CR=1 FL=1
MQVENLATITGGIRPNTYLQNPSLLFRVQKHLEERGWDQLRPSDIAKSISIEAAELLELFQWESITIEEALQDEKKLEKIKEELADVFAFAFHFANAAGLDISSIIQDKVKKTNDKYPIEKAKGKYTKYDQL